MIAYNGPGAPMVGKTDPYSSIYLFPDPQTQTSENEREGGGQTRGQRRCLGGARLAERGPLAIPNFDVEGGKGYRPRAPTGGSGVWPGQEDRERGARTAEGIKAGVEAAVIGVLGSIRERNEGGVV
jgi:hypothetical protein